MEQLKNIAYEETGGPQQLEFEDKLVGVTKWFDGTILDNIWKVKGLE
jgi:citrate lyase alpha subunit